MEGKQRGKARTVERCEDSALGKVWLVKCTQCDWSTKTTYKHTSSIYRHIYRVHRKIRYSCQQCPKSYSLKLSLKEHVKSKHEDFKWSCVACQKSFANITSLRKHKREQHPSPVQVPRDQTKFECAPCARIFLKELDLKRHVEFEHDDFRWMCEDCQEWFKSKEGLSQHLQAHH